MNVNARSIVNKSDDLEGLLIAYNPDITVVTETWLHDSIDDADVVPVTHEIIRHDRCSRGGGVALLMKKGVQYTLVPHNKQTEMVWIAAKLSCQNVVIGAVYRPPNADISMLEALHDFLYDNKKRYSCVIMSGEFNMPNIDWDLMCATSTCQHADLLLDISYAFDLHQVVHTPTCQTAVSSSILDLVFKSENVSQLGYTVDIVPGISDHFSVLFKSQLWHKAERSKPRPYYDFNNADNVSILDFLEQDYDFFLQCHRNFKTVNSLWLHLKCAVHHCMNKYILKKHKFKRQSPWITHEILHLKQRVKRLLSKN